ncbi:hypothetical protein ANCDUO_17158, partial [Ancylostoma duodenale]
IAVAQRCGDADADRVTYAVEEIPYVDPVRLSLSYSARLVTYSSSAALSRRLPMGETKDWEKSSREHRGLTTEYAGGWVRAAGGHASCCVDYSKNNRISDADWLRSGSEKSKHKVFLGTRFKLAKVAFREWTAHMWVRVNPEPESQRRISTKFSDLRHTETPFIITGCLFLGVGFAMLLVCGLLQRKNVVKFVLDLNRDLYFLNMNKSYMWKVMFENRAELPLAE